MRQVGIKYCPNTEITTIMNPMRNINRIVLRAKLRLLEMHFNSKSGHLGGNMSCLEAIITLHHLVMDEHDRFILSKGHSAGALYVTLWSKGKLDDASLDTFAMNGTKLPGHPSGSGIPDLLFSTGSLGHGPSLAAGIALGLKSKGESHRVYCLCSDGEWQEGSCWEALAFAVHHQLGNLTILIDDNKLQGFGVTAAIQSGPALKSKITSFGANVRCVNGHDCCSIEQSLKFRDKKRPTVIILDTIKGNGLENENTIEAHYLPLTPKQYATARSKLAKELNECERS